jgi:hypothetical protein
LPADVWKAPDDQVAAIYRQKYWDAMNCDQLPAGIDYCVFDYGVNSGIGRAPKILQRILHVADDGKIGPNTIAAAKAANAAKVIGAICDERMAFLRGLSTWGTFGRGWSRRVSEVRDAALKMTLKPPAPTQPEEHRGGSAVGGLIAACVEACASLFKGKPAEPEKPAEPASYLNRVVAAYKNRGDKLFTGPGERNIFYVRGQGVDKVPNGNPFDNRFNDYCGVLSFVDGKPVIVFESACTIDPGKQYVYNRIHPAGGASIKIGQYTAWVVRYHNGNHEALCQDGGPVTVTSDDDENGPTPNDSERSGHFGINQHGPGTGYGDRLLTDIGPVSAGCLVRPSMPLHRSFMGAVKGDPRFKANKSFVFTTSIFAAKDVA